MSASVRPLWAASASSCTSSVTCGPIRLAPSTLPPPGSQTTRTKPSASPSQTALELPLKRTCATSCSMPSDFALSSVTPQLATSGELNTQLGIRVRSQCRLEPVTAFSAAMAPWW